MWLEWECLFPSTKKLLSLCAFREHRVAFLVTLEQTPKKIQFCGRNCLRVAGISQKKIKLLKFECRAFDHCCQQWNLIKAHFLWCGFNFKAALKTNLNNKCLFQQNVFFKILEIKLSFELEMGFTGKYPIKKSQIEKYDCKLYKFVFNISCFEIHLEKNTIENFNNLFLQFFILKYFWIGKKYDCQL